MISLEVAGVLLIGMEILGVIMIIALGYKIYTEEEQKHDK